MNYIIDFEQTTDQTQINEYLADNNLVVVKVYDNFEKVYLVEGLQTPPTTSIVTSVIEDDLEVLELLGVVDITDTAPEITFSNDEQNWWKTYSLRKIDLDAPTITMKMKGDKIAVYLVDSGIDATHEEFDGATITNLYSVTEDFTDTTGHGTALASLIVGKTCAFSNPHLKVVKVFDQAGQVKQSQLLNAFDAIITDVLANPNKISIANLSWAIAKNAYIEQKLQVLLDHSVVVVCAAGNSGVAIEDVTPASMDPVITIGAYDQDLAPCDFSNYTGSSVITYTDGSTNGGALDGWAPGDKIYVAINGGGYGYAVGTSVASAIHSAICAYNALQMTKDDGDYLMYTDDLAKIVKDMSLSRRDLLTYNDVKYDNSANYISTCFNEFTPEARVPKSNEYVRFISGQTRARRVFHPLLVKSYELIDGTLPDGFEIQNGAIYGTRTIDDEYETSTIKLRLDLGDGHMMEQTINILVRQPEFVTNTLPTDDPVLAIFALDTCGGSVCAADCQDDLCTCGDGKGLPCYCNCQTCECF